jgi:fructan beta-fructosidase
MKQTFTLITALIASASLHAAEDIIIADFEGETYGAWKVEGEAFGKGPAHGAIGHQMPVSGFQGKGLVNSFNGGDGATGRLTSPAFKVERKFISFLVGGGGWAGETCMNLLVDGKVVRTATGSNTKPGGSEALEASGWEVAEFVGKEAVIQIVDSRKGVWGHINVDHIVQTDAKPALAAPLVALEKTLTVDGTHLLVPVSNAAKGPSSVILLGIYDGETLVQDFTVGLPQGNDASWLAAYPIEHFGLKGKQIKIAPVDGRKVPESCSAAFEKIKIGAASDVLKSDDYAKPYRNQFHVSTRRGWNNDPNGMVFAGGQYHLYYQHNPFGISWGNMHWGHLESADLVHWEEKPIALFQKTTRDMAFSGGGFVDHANTAGLGKDTQFAAFTSTGRGECLAYSKDGGLTFTELPENPVVKNKGRDPKVIWYPPEQKWVMAVFDSEASDETAATPPKTGTPEGPANHKIAFYESKNLRQWNRTGAFTDPDRMAVFECPEMFELPIATKPGETRWVLLAAQNRYFIGKFDGKTFHEESGPYGTTHGAFYAAQTFSDVPDGRRIEIGWVRTDMYGQQFPDQIVNQAFTLPHEMTLRETKDGLRIFYSPVKELENLRGEVLAEGKDLTAAKANELLQKCAGELSEVLIEFADAGANQLTINGTDASFNGRSARIFTDRTFNEVYADDGISYELRKPQAKGFPSTETRLTAPDGTAVRSLKVFRLKSIWNQN